jgi:hypothetical protein
MLSRISEGLLFQADILLGYENTLIFLYYNSKLSGQPAKLAYFARKTSLGPDKTSVQVQYKSRIRFQIKSHPARLRARKCKCTVATVHAIKAYRGSRGAAPVLHVSVPTEYDVERVPQPARSFGKNEKNPLTAPRLELCSVQPEA